MVRRQQAARYRKQISLDLMRTMPSNVKFSTPGSRGIMDLQDVLLAFCIHNPDVGYCQGMNFLVAMALLFMDAQDAFWHLVAVTECYHSPSYFDHNLLGAQADQSVLRDLMDEKMPELARHLDAIEIEISTVTLNWFLALFFDAVPFQTLLRVWDCFLLEGPKVLFRFSLAILHSHKKEIMRKTDTISVMRHLKACARIAYDTDGLVQVAFKTLKPFPRRHNIVSKQTFYLNGLKEKYMWRELQRTSFSERDRLLDVGEVEAEVRQGVFECCTITRAGEAWVAYCSSTGTKVCVVDFVEQVMTDTTIQIDSRVLCMSSTEGECVFMGTLSSVIYAWSQETRCMAWHHRVHDAVLSLQVFQEPEGDSPPRLFAALADGTIAVFETVSLSCKVNDLLYLPIGQSAVSCLQLLGNQLWCASGNTVSIIHASTLDPMDQFNVSSNPYDTILSMVPGLPGVWISVRGSSVLELWDPATLSCKMLYDTSNGKCPNLKKEDDTYFNSARITSILALDHSVWVGTGEGALYTFDVFTHQGMTSHSSSFIADSILELDGDCGHSLKSFCEKDSDPQNNESYTRIVEVEKRVKDLYLQRLVRDGFSEKKKSKRKDEDEGDEEEDNDTETEERTCLILDKEGREVRRTKRRGKDEERTKTGDSARAKRRAVREKQISADNVLAKNNKNSKISLDDRNKMSVKSETNLTMSSDKRTDDKMTVLKKLELPHEANDNPGIDNSNRRPVLRKSLSLDLPDNRDQDELFYRNCVNRSNSRNSSTSSVHVLDRTIQEEEEEELLNEKLVVNSIPGIKTTSSPKKPAPDFPTVYYLFKPEAEEEGKSSYSSSNTNNTIVNTSDEQPLAKPRESPPRTKKACTPTSSPRDITKSEDSGISCSAEKNTDGMEVSDGILTADETIITETGCENKHVTENQSDSKKETSGCLECYVNASSQFYHDKDQTCSNGADVSVPVENGTRHSTVKAVNSLKSNGRSMSEESTKTTGSDDVFCDKADNDPTALTDDLDTTMVNANDEDTTTTQHNHTLSPKTIPVSKLSFQLEMDDQRHENGEKTIMSVSEKNQSPNKSLQEEKTEEISDAKFNINKVTGSDCQTHYVNGSDDTGSSFKSSKSIDISRTPESTHSRKRNSDGVSISNGGLDEFINTNGDHISEGIYSKAVSNSIANGIHRDPGSSSEEEDSFGDFVGEIKVNGEVDDATEDLPSKEVNDSDPFPRRENREKIVDDFSDQQSESAYSTSSDSFHSDPESDTMDSFTSVSNVKTLAAKFENKAAEDEKLKSPPNGTDAKWKAGHKHVISNSIADTGEDASVFPKGAIRSKVIPNERAESPVRRTHLKLCRLSSSGQSEFLAHEACSSASSSDKFPPPASTSSTSRTHNSSSKNHHSRQILTTTSNGKVKLSKRSSSQRLLRAVKDNEQKETGDEIDTRYYGDSDEDKRVHEARVKSFKDSYAIVSNRRLSLTNSQKGQTRGDDVVLSETGKSHSELPPPVSALPNSQDPHPHTLPSTETTHHSVQNSIGLIPKNSQNPVSKLPSSPPPPISQPFSNNTDAFPDSSSRHNSIQSVGRLNSDVSSVNGNVQPRDAGARWRLDYTNVHVDTDMESLAFSFDGDSVITDTEHGPRGRSLSGMGVSTDCQNQRMSQFLRDTASTLEDHYSRHNLDDEKVSFLQTPTLSRSNSVCWSSYDEISTPSQCEGDTTLPGKQVELTFPRSTTYSLASRSTSVASTVDVQFSVDMSLLSKNKIADRPVKWLLRTEMRGKPTVLSLSGAHTDDEAVLVWTREVNETLWTNCPIFAYNPKTKTSTLPSYMRSQISSSSSSRSSPRQRLASFNST